MDGKKVATIHTTSSTILPSTPPRHTRRQPPHLGFLGLSIICSSSTPSATSRPGLDSRRSTKEQRSHVDHRGSHARHRTQGLSPSRHQHHHDTPGSTSPRHPGDGWPLMRHVAIATSTVPAEPSPPRHRLRVFCTPRPPLEPIKEEADGSPLRAS
jgi:hypothetical protein